MSRISVIVPIYKAEKYLNRCIDSILNQTFTDFECILVDDGSHDRCPQICDEYAKKDKRVKVIHKENGGVSAARNTGLNEAKGEYISFVDSDDWVHPQMLEVLYDTAKENGVGIVSCNHIKTGKNCLENTRYNKVRAEIYSSNYVLNNFLEKFFWRIQPYVWGKLYKRNCFEELKFDAGMTIYEDEYIYPELIEAAQSIAIINEKLYYYFENESSVSRGVISQKHLLTFKSLQHLIDFMKTRGIYNEVNLFEYKWMMAYMTLYYETAGKDPYMLKELKKYKHLFRKKYISLFINPEISKGYKLLLLLFIISPNIAKKLYLQLIS